MRKTMPVMTRPLIAAILMTQGWLCHAQTEGIFTCVDAKGRRLTADRPIIECIDREQRELSPSGTVRRKIGPTLTAEERAAEEDKARRAAEERSRAAEDKRRDRALLTRYPNRATHDKERYAATTQIDTLIATATKQIGELTAERKRFDTELEFFKGDLAKASPKLKRQIEENERQLQAEQRFLANQEAEKKRLTERYDEELGKLKALWALKAGAATAGAAAPPASP
jgi:hypothetical protein